MVGRPGGVKLCGRLRTRREVLKLPNICENATDLRPLSAKFCKILLINILRYNAIFRIYYTSKNEIPLIVILALPLISGPGKQYFAILCDISYITLLKTRYLS